MKTILNPDSHSCSSGASGPDFDLTFRPASFLSVLYIVYSTSSVILKAVVYIYFTFPSSFSILIQYSMVLWPSVSVSFSFFSLEYITLISSYPVLCMELDGNWEFSHNVLCPLLKGRNIKFLIKFNLRLLTVLKTRH